MAIFLLHRMLCILCIKLPILILFCLHKYLKIIQIVKKKNQ